MNTWDQLITEQQRLNSIASNIQGFSIDENGEPQIKIKLDKTEVSKFVNDYLSWYSDCLVLLPDDLSERFRSEYENKVKAFIIEPTIFDYKEHKDEYDHSYFEGYFKYDYSTYFYPAFFTHRQILLEASRRLNKPATTPTVFEAVEVIERLGRRFGLIAHQLGKRYNNRETLTISDEYDVQNLFHAVLRLFFDDIRSEEYTPSHSGKSSRIDFLLKSEEIVIEIKKTRSTLTEKEIGDELIIDKERYRAHPNCKTLIAFIYDPDKYIDNPVGLEVDLSEATGDILVNVIVAQS